MYMYKYIYISSRSPKTIGVEYSYIDYMRDIIKIYGSVRCMAIIILVFQGVYKKILTQRIYNATERKLYYG